jgi:protein TonB
MRKVDVEEKKSQRTGLIATIGFHTVLLILFFFLLAWSEPDPPVPEYGIELSFVQSDSKGKVESVKEQAQEVSEDSEDEAVEPSEQEPIEEVVEEQVEELAEESEPAESADEEEEIPVEEESEPTDKSEIAESEDVNSPDIVEEKKEEEKKEEEKKEVEQQKEKSTPKKSNSNDGAGESKSENKPAPKPTLDSRAIYKGSKGESNSQSSSGGSSLNMSGWIWDFEPEPDDQSDESGKVIFKIIVDDEGVIIQITTLEKTVSPIVEKKYKDAVMDLTFSKTSENRSTATTSSGKITFIIKSR